MTSLALMLLAGAAGLTLGSYAVTTGLRLSNAGSARGARSHCDDCGHRLGFALTIPLISYLYLKGACRYCKGRIDPTHLAGEAAGAAVLLSAPWSIALVPAAIMSAMGLLLIVGAAFDVKTLRLPNLITGGVAVAAFSLTALKGLDQLAVAVCASLLTGVVLLSIRAASKRRGRAAGLGLGDVKLAAALALWLSTAAPLMILAASVLGLAAAPFIRDEQGRLPFGPMIAAAGWGVGVALEHGWLPWLA